jgi:hypothetical protein
MLWVPIAAWCAAATVALVVLGFCAYEIRWKTKRLRGDLQTLQQFADQLVEVRGQLGEARERVAAAGLR